MLGSSQGSVTSAEAGTWLDLSASWRRRLAVLAALLVLGIAFQGRRAIWEPDEGRYVGSSLQMLRTGDWMTPMRNLEVPNLTKPPLAYWLIASSMATFGQTEYAARLPNGIAFVLTILLVFQLGRLLTPASPALPAVVYATSLFPFFASNIVTTDTILTLCETLAVCGFVRFWLTGRSDGLLWMWFGFGVGFLTKGPPALLPLLAILVFVGFSRPFPLRRLFTPTGVVLFLVLAFTWYAAQTVMRPDLLPYLLGREVFDRLATSAHRRNGGLWGWLVYVPVVLLGMLPWPLLMMLRRGRRASDPSRQERFLLFWILVPLAVFLLSQSRLRLYLLPLAAPAALLIAGRLRPDLLRTTASRVLLGTWIVLLLGARFVAGAYPSDRDPRPLASWIRQTLGHAPYEVVFVGLPPMEGLSFYLGAEIESVDLSGEFDDDIEYRPLSERLSEEISEPKVGQTVYVVASRKSKGFERQLRKQGLDPVRLATDGELILYDDPR